MAEPISAEPSGSSSFRGWFRGRIDSAKSLLKPANKESDEERVLRESQALLALLRDDKISFKSASPPPTRPPPPPASSASSSASESRLIDAAAASPAQLRAELALFVRNASNPLGALLCSLVEELKREHGATAAEAAEAPSTEAPPEPIPMAGPRPLNLGLLFQNLRSSSSSSKPEPAAKLDAAVRAVHTARETLQAALDEQLPPSLRESPAALHEARSQLDLALFRALHQVLSPLYLEAHGKDIHQLAQQCHLLRCMLPCDVNQLPRDVWLLPEPKKEAATTADDDDDGYGRFRECGVSDAHLPYASAIQLLRTISFYRTPSEKAQVLLEACEEIVKCATRARKLSQSSQIGGANGGGGGGSSTALGADDLLPLVVYVVLRSKVASLPAELSFVAEFLGSGLQYGREGYALVSLQCANRVALEVSWGCGLLLGATARGVTSAAEEQSATPDVSDAST